MNKDERKRLRTELNSKYREQAEEIHKNKKPSKAIAAEIRILEKKLKVDVKEKSSWNFKEKKQEKPKPVIYRPRPILPNPLIEYWECAQDKCSNRMPKGSQVVIAARRYYCCVECALKDAGIYPVTLTPD